MDIIIPKDKKYQIKTGVKLTPKMALDWLETVKRNRNINEKAVREYAQQIKEGKWVSQNSETIAFDWNGELRDGQHRCWAVDKAKKSILVDVAFGLDPDSIRTIDCGKKRTIADTLVMEEKGSGRKLANANVISTSLRIVNNYLKGNIYNRRSVTNDEVYDLFVNHPGIVDSAEKVKKFKLGSKSVLCAFHYIIRRVKSHEILADSFVESLISGEELPSKSPILTLRNKLITVRDKKQSTAREPFLISCLTKAWEAYKNGKTLASITFNPDSLPKIKRKKNQS